MSAAARNRHARGIAALLAASLACLPAPAAAQQPAPVVRKRTVYEDLQMFSQVLNQLRVNHPDSLDAHVLIMGAIRGMLAAADPHSYVIATVRLDPAKEKAFRENKLYPVPIMFDFIEGSPVVLAVAPGSTAAREDILAGDELVAIDGQPVRVESTFELDVVLSGPKHSTVALTFRRQRSDGRAVSLVRTVRRERVEETSVVATSFMWDEQTGYVRVTTFASDRAADDLNAALGVLEKRGMKRLVLDLRDNGGGLVREAATAAGAFLPERSVVYTQEGRKQDVLDTGRVSRSFWRREKQYPMVVMISAGTASAAELVAGALQDHDRALVVGQPSFGKALLMRGFPLAEGSVAFIVIGHLKTPCGRVIQRQYRGLARRSYYVDAHAERDTTGLPSCRTRTGRLVFGGGGITPDVVLPLPDAPDAWVTRLRSEGLLFKWTPGHVSAAAAAYPSLEDLARTVKPADGAVQEFRRFAAAQGVALPEGPEVDAHLGHAIAVSVAFAKWGVEGYYRVLARLDGDIERAVDALPKAEALLSASSPR